MHIATIVLTFALVLLLIASAVYRSRSQKRAGKAFVGLERSQRELGELIAELSSEVDVAASENADLIARLEVAVATGGDDVRGDNPYAVGAACPLCGNVRESRPIPTHGGGAGIAASIVAVRHWHIESRGYSSLRDFHTREERPGAAVWGHGPPSETDDEGEPWTSGTWLDRSGAYPYMREGILD